jgi:hypothetical protein
MLRRLRNFLMLWVIFLIPEAARAQQLYSVSGTLRDTAFIPVADVAVFIKNGRMLARTDGAGHFKAELARGTYELVFSHVRYETQVVPVTLEDGPDTVNLLLTPLTIEYEPVVISTRRKDPAPEVMRQAIRARDRWANQYQSLQSEIYIRATEIYEAPEKKKRSGYLEKEEERADSIPEPDSTRVSMNLAEVILTRHFKQPGKTKEIRTAVSKRGDPSGLFYLSTTEAEFNFYQNLLYIPALSDQPLMSPLSSTAMLGYRFRFLKMVYDSDSHRIYRIRVIPRQATNALFSGIIEIQDTLFCIRSLELDFPKNVLNEYDRFTLRMAFDPQDSFLLPSKLDMQYYAKAGQGKFDGSTRVRYRSHTVNPVYPARFFDNELSSATREAYERDSSYWAERRAVPLDVRELRFVNRDDSLRRVRESKAFKDSVTRETNKVTPMKLFLLGQTYTNPDKGWNLNFIPLAFIYNPIMIGGGRINFTFSGSKEFKNKQFLSLNPNLNYGILNKDIMGDVSAYWLYNPFSRGSLSVSAGRSFGFINPFDAYVNLFRRSNFFQHEYMEIGHRLEVFNGFYVGITAEYSDRRDISGYRFDTTVVSAEGNQPLSFDPYTATYARITLSYTPFQKYIREPYQKLILGSKWPTFVLQYRKGIPGLLNSEADFDYLEYRVEHEFPLGLAGRSEFRITSGKFHTMRNVQLIDYKYQRRGDPFLLTAPMYTFQLLDSTYPTFRRYFEGHYVHRFNGSLLNKLPFLKPLELRETAGGGFLVSQERNMRYVEGFAGLEKVVRVWRERFKIGFYYTAAASNQWSGIRTAWKVGFAVYNRFSNEWL